MPVNKERVQLLADALLSGEYRQTRHQLEIILTDGTKRQCCLGVACRVAMAHGVEVDTYESGSESDLVGSRVTYFEGNMGTMPTPVQEWFGFDSGNPVLLDLDRDPDSEYGSVLCATDANDNGHYNFEQIGNMFKARYIDSDVEE